MLVGAVAPSSGFIRRPQLRAGGLSGVSPSHLKRPARSENGMRDGNSFKEDQRAIGSRRQDYRY